MRLVTWNLLWRFGNWEARQPLIVAGLLAEQPDVVLLQETWPAQARELAAALGLELLGFSGGYFDQTLSSVPVDAEFGNAILARSGEIEIDEPLDAPGDPAPRRLLVARVDGRRFATSHLSHMAEAGPSRAAQIRRIDELLGHDEGFVFGGDCNLVPHSDEHGVAVSLGWRDLWAEQHLAGSPGHHGPTMTPDNPEIHYVTWMDERNGDHVPAGTGIRLDYLWATSDVECGSITQFGRGDTDRWPSDHLGLSTVHL